MDLSLLRSLFPYSVWDCWWLAPVALLLDLRLGDPALPWPHPVCFAGRLLGRLEGPARRWMQRGGAAGEKRRGRLAGLVCLFLLTGVSGLAVWLLISLPLLTFVAMICGMIGGAVVCALTLVLATIRIPLPTGSNITCGSWIPLMLLALLYDYRLSMLSGWVCGILAMILIPGWQAVHWAQIFVQQLVCFSCLGYAGVFGSDKRWKAICGMALAVAIRCFGHVISGVIFYSQNAWDGWGAWGYSLAFNLSSRLPEGILSILIVSVLPLTLMRRAIARREAK